MSKITLTNLASLQNENTVITAINANNATLISAIDNTISRDGSIPNSMSAELDMNSNQIINIADGTHAQDAVSFSQLEDAVLDGLGITLANSPVSTAMQPVVLSASRNVAHEYLGDFDTRTDVSNFTLSSDINFVRTAGYTTVGDGGGALYKRVTSEPSHSGKVQSLDGTWWEIKENIIYPEQLGGNVQNAVTVATSIGAELRLVDSYSTSSVITISSGLKITGLGPHTGINPTTNTIGVLKIDTIESCVLRDFSIIYPSYPVTDVKGIEVTCTSPNVNGAGSGGTLIENVNIQLAFVGISLNKTSTQFIKDCVIKSKLRSIEIMNSVADATQDIGDSTITGCNLASDLTSGIAVYQESSGGVRFINNKINGAHHGYFLNVASGANTGVLLISDNSIEGIDNVGGASIVLQRQGVTGGFSVIKVSDNELSGAYGVISPVDATGIWASDLSITGNIFLGPTAGVGVLASLEDVQGFMICNNIARSVGAGSVQITSTAASASYGIVGPNLAYGTVVINGISSTNTTTVTPV